MTTTNDLIARLRRITKVSYGATIEEAREVSQTLREAAELIEWKPIATAPKDSSWFLAWRKHGSAPYIVRWGDDYSEYEDLNGDHIYNLTHWMSLPTKPEPLL